MGIAGYGRIEAHLASMEAEDSSGNEYDIEIRDVGQRLVIRDRQCAEAGIHTCPY